ncbi:hypothetical protein HA402_015821 [Bradysia odoriphaga]|nr:hypothetical protein HA402_015821 [Bradysia odoriphaga]
MHYILLAALAVLCVIQSGHSCDDCCNCDEKNDDPIECCNKVSAKNKLSPDQIKIVRNVLTNGLSGLKGLLGITDILLNLDNIVGDIGFQCSPLAVPVVGAAAGSLLGFNTDNVPSCYVTCNCSLVFSQLGEKPVDGTGEGTGDSHDTKTQSEDSDEDGGSLITVVVNGDGLARLAATDCVARLAATDCVARLAATDCVARLAATDCVARLAATDCVARLAATDCVARLAATDCVAPLNASNNSSLSCRTACIAVVGLDLTVARLRVSQ